VVLLVPTATHQCINQRKTEGTSRRCSGLIRWTERAKGRSDRMCTSSSQRRVVMLSWNCAGSIFQQLYICSNWRIWVLQYPPSQTSLSSSGTLARLLLPLIQYSRCCYGSLSTVRRKEGRTLASRIWMPGEPDAEGALCLALCPCVGGLTSRDQRRTDGCSRRGLGCVVARLTPLFVCLYPPRAGPCSGSYPPGHRGRRL
jgi:hypothetical protein